MAKPPAPKFVYKLRDVQTGLFKTARDGWNSQGKAWNNAGHLKSHVRVHEDRRYDPVLRQVVYSRPYKEHGEYSNRYEVVKIPVENAETVPLREFMEGP